MEVARALLHDYEQRLMVFMQLHRHAKRLFAAWLFTLYGGWVVAWGVFRAVNPVDPTLWWVGAKLAVWVAPVAVLMRLLPLPFEALESRHTRRVGWAGAISLAWVGLNALGDTLLHRTPAAAFNASVLSACLVSPLLEELLFRGFAFAWLERSGLGYWKTNLASALLFALLHLPGWVATQGLHLSLGAQLAQTAALGFFFGLVRWKHGSLWAPVLVHMANNAWSQGLIRWLWQACFSR